jgi:hypothetical protein
MKIVQNPGRAGIGANSNSGLSHLTTSHCWVIHQDDWLFEPHTVTQIYATMRSDPNAWLVLARAQADPKLFMPRDCPIRSSWNGSLRLALGRNFVGPPSVVVFPLLEGLRFSTSLSLLVDVDLYRRLARQLGSFVPVDAAVAVGEWAGQSQRSMGRLQLAREVAWMHMGQGRRLLEGFGHRH